MGAKTTVKSEEKSNEEESKEDMDTTPTVNSNVDMNDAIAELLKGRRKASVKDTWKTIVDKFGSKSSEEKLAFLFVNQMVNCGAVHSVKKQK